MEGCYLQEYYFRPTFNKWKNERCGGFMIHVIDPITYRPYRTSLALLTIIKETYGDEFTWRKPPYEYDFERFPIDLILGDASIRLALEEGKESKELIADYIQELEGFLEFRKPYLIYKE